MFHYVNRFLSHVFSVNGYFYAHFYLYVFAYKDSILFFCFYFRRYISVCRVSVSVKYTLLGVLNLCYPNNVFEKLYQNRCQNRDFSYPDRILVGIRDFQAKSGES